MGKEISPRTMMALEQVAATLKNHDVNGFILMFPESETAKQLNFHMQNVKFGVALELLMAGLNQVIRSEVQKPEYSNEYKKILNSMMAEFLASMAKSAEKVNEIKNRKKK